MSNNPLQFRAWDGHRMCRVDSLSFNAHGTIWHGPDGFGWAWIDETRNDWSENNPKPEVINPVMRFTGFRDQQGVSIFEGDIIDMAYSNGHERDASGDISGRFKVVMARSGEWELEGENLWSSSELNQSLWLCAEPPDYRTKGWSEFKVVGNVYSNPDLLKS